MSKLPVISVIVPFYNAEIYLEECIIGLLTQTQNDLEFIFVDDCSTDSGLVVLYKVLNIFQERRTSVKIIKHTRNMGVATARNTGLHAARGKYIAWVDADDWIESNMLESMFEEAERTNADILWTDFYNKYENTEDYIIQECKCTSLDIIKSLLDGYMIGALWNKLIKRSLFIDFNIRFPDGLNMCEDLRVSIELFYYALKVTYLPNAFYKYNKCNQVSISTQNASLPKRNLGWIENLKGIEFFIKDKGLFDQVEGRLLKRKLSPKKNLLVKGNSIEAYKEWKDIFPESNKYIWRTNMPIHYKILAWCVYNELWGVIFLWIGFKKKVVTLLKK